MHLQESQGVRGGSSACRGVSLFYTSLGYPGSHDFELLRLSAGKAFVFVFTIIVLLVSFLYITEIPISSLCYLVCFSPNAMLYVMVVMMALCGESGGMGIFPYLD